jgi:nitrogen fixation NifU-like protein
MFNEIIVENFSNPRFAEELAQPDLTLELGNPVCGDRIEVRLQIGDGIVTKARYQAWGCAASLATGNIFCGYVDAKPVATLRATPQAQLDALLGELEPSQYHCLEMLRALFAQLASHSLPA